MLWLDMDMAIPFQTVRPFLRVHTLFFLAAFSRISSLEVGNGINEVVCFFKRSFVLVRGGEL